MQHILLIEDDNDINCLIKMILQREGYHVTQAYSGTEGKLLFGMQTYDLVLCDLMLPGMIGEEVIECIRGSSTIPIIVLTAKSGIEDKESVFGIGADDYITKPFEPRELVVRVKSQLRRAGYCVEYGDKNITMDNGQKMGEEASQKKGKQLEDTLCFRELVMNLDACTVHLHGVLMELTQREFQILQTMLEYPKKVFSKEALYEAVWKAGYYGEDNTISVHISNIRKKMECITKEEYISTVWGIGYRLHL